MTGLRGITDILVIDDDALDRMAIRRYVSRPHLNVRVQEAATGEAGAALLAAQRFDCLFLDYRLPDMDGVAFLKRFYDLDADLMPCPVVMLTGQGSEGVMTDALRWGAHDYIIKDNISADTLNIALIKAREIFDLRRARLQTDEKLRHAQKMDAVGQLTSGIAHDFNNLLTVILGNTHLMLRRLPNIGTEAQEKLGPKVEAIETAARKGADLVRHLMVFTRQRELKEVVFDPNRCIADTLLLLKRTLGETIEVREHFAEDIGNIRVDTGLFENAVINIAVNARDAMKKGGRLDITTENVNLTANDLIAYPEMSPNSYVLIAIADNGEGMPESVRQRIFEPFYTTKPAGEGTGLGLSMVYGFIRQSGGHIQVDSTPGAGTIFRIYLPRDGAADISAKETVHG